MGLENKELLGHLFKAIRGASAFHTLYRDLEAGKTERLSEEVEVERNYSDALNQLETILAAQDQETLIKVIVALVGSFGDVSTEEGEERRRGIISHFVDGRDVDMWGGGISLDDLDDLDPSDN
jgi:hypothetical protein